MVSEKKIEKRIKELVSEIKEHNQSYYDKDSPLITDFEYDMKLKELAYLEENFPHLVFVDSPLNKVGGTVSASFQKVTHQVPMLSLANSYSKQEIIDFDSRVTKSLLKEVDELKELRYCCELKMDGLAVSLIYKDGLLYKAITRGDGKIGEDVTENIKRIEDIPKSIICKDELEIRGEVYLKRERLKQINEKRKNEGEAEFANARNAAAGTIRQLDSNIVGERGLSFSPYYLVSADRHGLKIHSEMFSWLKKQGFVINDNYLAQSDLNQVIKFCEEWENKQDELSYDFDGIVIKVEDLLLQELLGSNMKTPKWAIAYKFLEEVATTILEDVLYQVGRLGTITPVAVLKPVEISGAMVERATLHNCDFIQQKGVAINDEVVVKRAAEVIPAVVMVSHQGENRKEIIFPSNCPICSTVLKQDDDNVAIYCPNLKCKGRLKAQLIHVVSRDAFNIGGIGDKLIEQLVEQEVLTDWLMLFELDKDTLGSLERMGDKSINNIVVQLEKSKQIGLAKIIFAIGIKQVGYRSAELLSFSVSSYEELFKMEVEDFLRIEGIGEKTALFLKEFFDSERAIQIFEYFNKKGFDLSLEQNFVGSIFLGKKVVITGSFKNYSRSEMFDLIKAHQGTVSSSVSKNTDYVVVGENPGSKMQKATEFGVSIISEDEIEGMLSK